MAQTQATEKKDPTVEKVLGIVESLRTEIGKLNARNEQTAEHIRASQGRFEKRWYGVQDGGAKEIAGALREDSEAGKALKNLLVSMRERSLSTHDPFGVAGLSLLESIELVKRNSPDASSLWADVDTYETDPMTYSLTKFGRKVVDMLAPKDDKSKTKS